MPLPRFSTRFPRGFLFLPLGLALLAACSEAPPAAPPPPGDGPSGSWPQWRGPQRDGSAASQGLLDAWDAQGPPVLWRRPLGEGLGGIAVADGKALVLAADSGKEFLVALDARRGDELWRTTLGKTFLDGHGNGPRTTPLIADGKVYAHGSRRLVATDLETGKIIWQHALAEPPEWGYSSSPLLVDERLIVHSKLAGDEASDTAVLALDRHSGDLLWSSEAGHPGYASPLVAELAGRRQIVSFIGEGLAGLDPITGQRLWHFPWKTSYNVNAADPLLLSDDRIFISSGYQNGAALLAITTDATGALEANPVWNSRSMKNHFSSSVRVGDHLYGFDNATFKCISIADGQTLWRERGFGKGSLIVADDKLIVLTDDGWLVLLDPTPNGYVELGRVEVLEGDSWTPPSLAGQWLYVRDHQDIVCLNLAA